MLSKFEEMKLVAQCMATDNREAFSRLVVAYEPGVKRFLMNMVGGDAALTDDLAQETFLRLGWPYVASEDYLASRLGSIELQSTSSCHIVESVPSTPRSLIVPLMSMWLETKTV